MWDARHQEHAAKHIKSILMITSGECFSCGRKGLPVALKTGMRMSTRSWALLRNIASSDMSNALSKPPTILMVVSNSDNLAFWSKFRLFATHCLALEYPQAHFYLLGKESIVTSMRCAGQHRTLLLLLMRYMSSARRMLLRRPWRSFDDKFRRTVDLGR